MLKKFKVMDWKIGAKRRFHDQPRVWAAMPFPILFRTYVKTIWKYYLAHPMQYRLRRSEM